MSLQFRMSEASVDHTYEHILYIRNILMRNLLIVFIIQSILLKPKKCINAYEELASYKKCIQLKTSMYKKLAIFNLSLICVVYHHYKLQVTNFKKLLQKMWLKLTKLTKTCTETILWYLNNFIEKCRLNSRISVDTVVWKLYVTSGGSVI